jgi:uncharacterized membrane protein
MAQVSSFAPVGSTTDASVENGAMRGASKTLTISRVGVLVYAAAFLWGVGFSVGAGLEQRWFLLRRYDLGNFTQAIWSTAHGRLLEVTEVGGAQVSRLGIHVDPILLLLVPIWKVWPSPVMLLVVQALALAAGAIPLFWFARRHLSSERDAGLIAAAYLVSPTVGWNALHEFHAVALAVPLLIAAIWFLDTERITAFIMTAGAAAACQEQIGIVVACLCFWHAWRRRRLLPWAVIGLAGALVSALEFGVVLHHFSSGSPYYGRYAGVGGSFSGMLHKLFTDPAAIAAHVLAPKGLVWIGLLVLPVLGLCFGSTLILAATPAFALIMLSDRVNDLDFRAQTVLPIVPFLYAGTVLALARRGPTARFKAAHVLLTSVWVAAFFGPLHPGGGRGLPPSAHVAAARHAVALVPASAAVSTTNHLGAHLATRRRLYVFPVIRKAAWVVVDANDPYMPDLSWLRTRRGIGVGTRDLYSQPDVMRRILRRLNESPVWTRVFTQDGISVFSRRGSR